MFLSLCGRFTNRCTRPKVPLLTLPHGGALSVPRFNNRTAKVHILYGICCFCCCVCCLIYDKLTVLRFIMARLSVFFGYFVIILRVARVPSASFVFAMFSPFCGLSSRLPCMS